MADADLFRFNQQVAPSLAAQLGVTRSSPTKVSSRFAAFEDDDRFVMVVGAQKADVQRAMAMGLTHRVDRRLVLILPAGQTRATQQRVPWLKAEIQPTLYVHHGEGSEITSLEVLTRDETMAALGIPGGGDPPGKELRKASTPLHLGLRSDGVDDLVEWATTSKDLDAGHRRSERAWHYRGQKVLSIGRTKAGLRIRAGIHRTGDVDLAPPIDLADGRSLSGPELEAIRAAVEAGIDARQKPSPAGYGRPDEHWLQSVIRADPSIVGVEQPALREVPAWRPTDAQADDLKKEWGRGFIDLLGVDGHGNVRVVETKLAANKDDLLMFQGLDYFVWANAYADALRRRLGVGPKAKVVLHYVIGVMPGTVPDPVKLVSSYSAAQAEALDIDWRFQVVTDWYQPEDRPKSVLGPPQTLP